MGQTNLFTHKLDDKSLQLLMGVLQKTATL